MVNQADAIEPQIVGDDDLVHSILSQYRPPAIIGGCSQAAWLGEGGRH